MEETFEKVVTYLLYLLFIIILLLGIIAGILLGYSIFANVTF